MQMKVQLERNLPMEKIMDMQIFGNGDKVGKILEYSSGTGMALVDIEEDSLSYKQLTSGLASFCSSRIETKASSMEENEYVMPNASWKCHEYKKDGITLQILSMLHEPFWIEYRVKTVEKYGELITENVFNVIMDLMTKEK